jgi:hypothetical protein
MFIVFFFDIQGIVHKEFVPPGQTVNGKFYCEVLKQLRDSIRRKRPEKFSTTTTHPPIHRSLFSSFWLPKTRQWFPTHPVLCSVTHLYGRGTWLRLLLRHSRNTSRDVYRAACASAILFAASHSAVAWLPSNCCKQTLRLLCHVRYHAMSLLCWLSIHSVHITV